MKTKLSSVLDLEKAEQEFDSINFPSSYTGTESSMSNCVRCCNSYSESEQNTSCMLPYNTPTFKLAPFFPATRS